MGAPRREGPRCAQHCNIATEHGPWMVYLVLTLRGSQGSRAPLSVCLCACPAGGYWLHRWREAPCCSVSHADDEGRGRWLVAARVPPGRADLRALPRLASASRGTLSVSSASQGGHGRCRGSTTDHGQRQEHESVSVIIQPYFVYHATPTPRLFGQYTGTIMPYRASRAHKCHVYRYHSSLLNTAVFCIIQGTWSM